MSGTTASRLLRAPDRRSAMIVLVAAVLVAALCWYLGADVWDAILLASGITTLTVLGLVGAALEVGEIGWRGDGPTKRGGSRSDVVELSWSLRGSWGRVRPAVMWRVTRIARHRLARHELDLARPADRAAIERLIGRRAYLVLTRTERRAPRLRALLQCLDALDAIDPTDVTAPPGSKGRR